jgi:hypothetical protein
VGKNIRQWDLLLAQAEFAYNRSTSQTTGCNPFEVVYGLNPFSPLDLAPIPTTIQLVAMLMNEPRESRDSRSY